LCNLQWNDLPQKPSLLPHSLYFFNLMFLISLRYNFLNGFFNHASSIHIPSWCTHAHTHNPSTSPSPESQATATDKQALTRNFRTGQDECVFRFLQ
jgi:hypothetical protein